MHHPRRTLLIGAAALTLATTIAVVPAVANSEPNTTISSTASVKPMGTFVSDTPETLPRSLRRIAPGGIQPTAKFTWGWITGTIYFNKRETALIAAFGGVAGYLAAALGPWGVAIGSHIGSITAVASYASSTARCLKVKIPALTPGTYSGGYCT